MDLITGKTRSTSGRVFLHDTDITNWEEHKIARAGLGRKFQIPSVFKELTVRLNLEVASCKNPGVFANLGFGFGTSAKQNVDEVLELIGLTERPIRIRGLSPATARRSGWNGKTADTQNPKIILAGRATPA